jgi:hypothetical protein
VGILVSMAIIVVLFAVLMSAINTAVTGNGNTRAGTVRGVEDQMKLSSLAMGFMTSGRDLQLAWLEPAKVKDGPGFSANTTAILFSALVMGQNASLENLISSNERNPVVGEMASYNYGAYDMTVGRFYDPAFKADLERGSNVSFAHIPLYGERKRYWTEGRMDSFFPLLGSRGPIDGDTSKPSLTYGRDGGWTGFRLFGDGHVEATTSMQVLGRGLDNGEPDNVFKMESGPDGNDCILSFTKVMLMDGPELQFD